MLRKIIILFCLKGVVSTPVMAFYNCWDYCNPAAVAMIEQAYPLAAYRLTNVSNKPTLMMLNGELINQQINQVNQGQLYSAIKKQEEQMVGEQLGNKMQSIAQIYQRKSIYESSQSQRNSYPVETVAFSIDLDGNKVTADGTVKDDSCKVDLPNEGENKSLLGNVKFSSTNHGENEKLLVEIFNRLKLTNAGPTAVSYVNPINSKNMGAQPNEIYTIYNRTTPLDPERDSITLDYSSAERHDDATINKPLSIFELWATSPIINPDNIDQIFTKHAVDIEYFKQYADFSEVQEKYNKAIGVNPIKPISNGNTIVVTPGIGLGQNIDDVRENTAQAVMNLRNAGYNVVVIPPTTRNPQYKQAIIKATQTAGGNVVDLKYENDSKVPTAESVRQLIKSTDVLMAYGDEVAVVINKALGYKISENGQVAFDQNNNRIATAGLDNMGVTQTIANNLTQTSNTTVMNPQHNQGSRAKFGLTNNSLNLTAFPDMSCTWTSDAENNISSVWPKNRGMNTRDLILYYAAQEQYPWSLLMAQAKVESNFKNQAESNKGAVGIVQFMPATAGEKGKPWYHTDRTDPHQNVPAAIAYMKSHLNAKYAKNDIIRSLAAYNAGAGRVISKQAYVISETRNYVSQIMCYSKMFEIHGPKPAVGTKERFVFSEDLPIMEQLGFSTDGAYLPDGMLLATSEMGMTDEYGMEKYGIFVENANTYRNVERSGSSDIFAWLTLQYNSGISSSILQDVFSHVHTNQIDASDKYIPIEARDETVKTSKARNFGIGSAMVSSQTVDGKTKTTVNRGVAFNEELVNNYTQYISAYWFEPILVPHNLYVPTDRMTSEQISKYYEIVRQHLAISGTPNRIGKDRVPLTVLKALILDPSEADMLKSAFKASTQRDLSLQVDNLSNPFYENWLAEVSVAQMSQSMVTSVLANQFDFRLKPDKNAWPSYYKMAQHISENPDDIDSLVSPTLTLDIALWQAYNPYKYGISPEEAIDDKSYYSHKFYPFIRYFGDHNSPIGEEPNRITEQVVLDKTINYIQDPKFFEHSEIARADDLLRQIPKFTGLETYLAYRRLEEAQNKQKLLTSWASSTVAMGRAIETNAGPDISMDKRIIESASGAYSTMGIQ